MTDDEGLATLSHVLDIFFGFIGLLVIYLASDEDSFAQENAANALNFQIMVLIASFAAFIMTFVLIGALLIPLIILVHFIFCTIAAIKANNGVAWKYPLTPELV